MAVAATITAKRCNIQKPVSGGGPADAARKQAQKAGWRGWWSPVCVASVIRRTAAAETPRSCWFPADRIFLEGSTRRGCFSDESFRMRDIQF
ncbi:hypothetical protein ACFQPG_02560 [Sphingomonas sp. GCM10030256]|uniref:hypothetical protein n=1 Tax=Sphingomonas sp. GCM10030256 TaxID=3273427 RepID=UPI00360F9D9F